MLHRVEGAFIVQNDLPFKGTLREEKMEGTEGGL
jgi:hypothetical protein